MNRRQFIKHAAVGISAITISRWARAETPDNTPGKPNILIYLSDDHSLRDCSTYGALDIPTPHMDTLAAEGMKFTRAFVASPACAPSRSAMLTGLMPAHNGAEANHSKPRDDIKKLPEYMKELGYDVAAFGKVAHGAKNAAFGFDYSHPGRDVPILRRTVRQYLEERHSSKPLCLFVGTGNPHVGWPDKTSFRPEDMILPATFVDTPETRRYRAMYYQEIKELDELLGDLRTLAMKHLGRHTLFIYTSDHGAQWPFGKWNLYDDGIRTPFVAHWPGVIKPGTSTDAMISWIDILPTLVELAGGNPPRDIDGQSFASILNGRKSTHRERIFTTHSGDGNKNIYPIRSVRTDRWKYIRNLHPEFAYTTHIDLVLSRQACAYWTTWLEKARTDPHARRVVERYHARPKEELYDLTKDPLEQNNLAADPEHAEILRVLREELDAWMKQQGDSETVFNKPYMLDEPQTWPAGLYKAEGPQPAKQPPASNKPRQQRRPQQ